MSKKKNNKVSCSDVRGEVKISNDIIRKSYEAFNCVASQECKGGYVSSNEVYTPAWVENDMCNWCDDASKDKRVISNIDSTCLEPCVGTGNFIIEIVRRRLVDAYNKNRLADVFNNIYGFEIVGDSLQICKNRALKEATVFCKLVGFDVTFNIYNKWVSMINRNIRLFSFLDYGQNMDYYDKLWGWA